VFSVEREGGERGVIETIAAAERLKSENVFIPPFMIGVAELARLAERLRAGVDADPIALPLGDRLVAGQALVARQIARADVTVLAVILAVDVGVRLGERPGARREKIGVGGGGEEQARNEEESPEQPWPPRCKQGPFHGVIVAYQERRAKKI
jgi:hypothetical protein